MIKFDEQTNIFVTYSSALNIYSQGRTLEEAKLAMRDAIRSFITVTHYCLYEHYPPSGTI